MQNKTIIPVSVYNTATGKVVEAAIVYVDEYFSVNGKVPEQVKAIFQNQACALASNATNITYNFVTNVFAYCHSGMNVASGIVQNAKLMTNFNVTETVYNCLLDLNKKACHITHKDEDQADWKSRAVTIGVSTTAALLTGLAIYGFYRYTRKTEENKPLLDGDRQIQQRNFVTV